MKHKIINSLLGVAILFIFYIAVTTTNFDDTIDAIAGATPNNDVMDAIAGASDDDDHDEEEDD